VWSGSGQGTGSRKARHHQQQQAASQHAAAAAGVAADARTLWPVLVAALAGVDSGGQGVAAAEDPWGTTPLQLAPSADHLAALGLLQQPASGVLSGSSPHVPPAAAVGQAVPSPW
jgi:hypothetical protein